MSYTKMKPARKKELLKALRRPPEKGGYIQGRDQLVTVLYPGDWFYMGDEYEREVIEEEHQFCCLGVASDLMVQKGLITWDAEVVEANVNEWPDAPSNVDALESKSFPSDEVLEYFGISHKAAIRLASMNDEGKSFIKIADWIEKHL